MQNHFIQFSGSRAYNTNAYSGIVADTSSSSGKKYFENTVTGIDRQQIDEMFEQAEKKEKMRNAPGFSISMTHASEDNDSVYIKKDQKFKSRIGGAANAEVDGLNVIGSKPINQSSNSGYPKSLNSQQAL